MNRNARLSVFVGAIAAVAGATVWSIACKQGSDPHSLIPLVGSVECSGVLRSCTASSSGKRVIVMGDDLTVGAYVNDDGITISFREVPPGQEPSSPITADYFFATSFPVVDVAGRQSDEVFVLGSGNVIEKWTQEILTGSRYLVIKNAQVAPGVPVPDCVQAIKGGAWLSPDQRPKEIRQRRNVVLQKFEGVEFSKIHVDPEGRYLLLITKGDHNLYQLSLAPGSQPMIVADTGNFPNLPDYFGAYLAHHQSMGRVFIMERLVGASLDHLVFIDASNDGVFESSITLSQTDWTAQGMDGQVWFRPNFFDYSTE